MSAGDATDGTGVTAAGDGAIDGGPADDSGQRASGSAAVVYEELRQAIIHGRLAQGAVLSQVDLARQFGVSRTPLREALRMLQAEGFVESELNRKVRVASFAVEDLEQLYAARIVLEALGVSQSVPMMTHEDFKHLHWALREMDRHAETRDLDAWEAPHTKFHRGLVAYSGQRTATMIRQLADGALRYRRVYVAEGPRAWSHTAVEHRAIVAACEARDASGAAAELARHLARTALTVIAMVDPSHDPAPVRAALALVAPEAA
jgi:DNA-binding GntR family transcriptional regulator